MLGKGECVIQISKPRIGMWQMGAPNFFKSMNVFLRKGRKCYRIDSQRRWTFDLRVGDNEDTRTSDNIILSVY